MVTMEMEQSVQVRILNFEVNALQASDEEYQCLCFIIENYECRKSHLLN